MHELSAPDLSCLALYFKAMKFTNERSLTLLAALRGTPGTPLSRGRTRPRDGTRASFGVHVEVQQQHRSRLIGIEDDEKVHMQRTTFFCFPRFVDMKPKISKGSYFSALSCDVTDFFFGFYVF